MTTITVTHPMIITSRLLPGIRIGTGSTAATISIRPAADCTYEYWIDLPTGRYHATDLRQPAIGGNDIRRALGALLSFLEADAERYAGSGRMGTADPVEPYLFSRQVAEWAYRNADAIYGAGCALGAR